MSFDKTKDRAQADQTRFGRVLHNSARNGTYNVGVNAMKRKKRAAEKQRRKP